MGSYRSTNFNQRLRNFTSVIETVLNNPLSGNALLSLDAPYFIIYTLSNARRSQLSRADCCHSRQWVRYPISQFLLGRAILSPVWYMLNSLLIVPQIVQSLITFWCRNVWERVKLNNIFIYFATIDIYIYIYIYTHTHTHLRTKQDRKQVNEYFVAGCPQQLVKPITVVPISENTCTNYNMKWSS